MKEQNGSAADGFCLDLEHCCFLLHFWCVYCRRESGKDRFPWTFFSNYDIMPREGVNEERMGKKKNMLKRNSGFIIGCVVAAGASFFTADVLTSDQKLLQIPQAEKMTETSDEPETVPEECSTSRTYETDAFTVTASGTVIKGVETEAPEKETQQKQTDKDGNAITPETNENGNAITPETDENGNATMPETDENGNIITPETNGDGGSDYDGSGEDYYEQPVEILDPGGGDYYYDGGGNGGDDGGTDDGGGNGWNDDGGGNDGGDDGGGTETPDDVIIPGISSRYIDESELYNYDAGQLRLIRNEIFALHGRIFKSQDLADYFSQKSWYVPKYDPDEFDAHMFDYLNDYEAANLKVILNYEAALAGN